MQAKSTENDEALLDSLTEFYCLMDDFCKEFEPWLNTRLLTDGHRKRLRVSGLSLAGVSPIIWTPLN